MEETIVSLCYHVEEPLQHGDISYIQKTLHSKIQQLMVSSRTTKSVGVSTGSNALSVVIALGYRSGDPLELLKTMDTKTKRILPAHSELLSAHVGFE